MEARCYLAGRASDPRSMREEISSENPRLVVQAVGASAASNESYVEMIAAQTLRASSTGGLLARKPEIDIVLRLAGTTQIAAAIAKMGAKKGKPFLLVIAGESKPMGNLKIPAAWARLPRKGLSKEELGRIEDAALLNARRR